MLITLRRLLAIVIGLVFVGVFFLSLLLLRINATFLEPSFLKEEVRKADLFNFIYDQAVPAAAKESFAQQLADLPLGLKITVPQIASAVRKVLPPEWMEEKVEHVIDQVVPYFTGDADSFEINVAVADRVEAAVPATKVLLTDMGVYDIAFSKEFAQEVDKALKNFGELPFGVKIASKDLVAAVQKVATPQWLRKQVEGTLDQVVPYVSGKKESFSVTVPLADRVKLAVPAVKDLLRAADAYGLLVNQVITTLVKDNLGQLAELPFGVTITSQEVTATVKEVLPPEWVQQQVEGMLDAVLPYAVGEAEHFTITLPLEERLDKAQVAIEKLADRKLQEAFDKLSTCTPQQTLELVQSGFSGQLPPCKPAGLTFQDAKRQLGIDVLGGVIKSIRGQLPNVWTLTDVDLRKKLSAADQKRLDDALKTVREGWRYTDADLRKSLSADYQKQLDDGRRIVKDGWRYTDADLRQDLAQQEEGQETLQTLDQVREQMKRARSLKYVAYLIIALPLIVIGFLGGRRWRSRIAWAAAFLGLAALVVYLATGPVYSRVAVPLMDQQFEQIARDAQGELQMVVTQKLTDVAKMVAQDFLSGINFQALILLVVAVTTLALSLGWDAVSRTVGLGRKEPPGNTDS